jgi:hypothetical protein
MLIKRMRATAAGADDFVLRDTTARGLVAQSPAAVALLEGRSGFETLSGDPLAKEGRRRANERRDSFTVGVDETKEDRGVSSEEVDIFFQPARGGEECDARADRVGFQFSADVLFRGEVAIFVSNDRDCIQKDSNRTFLWGQETRWEGVCEDFPEAEDCLHGGGTGKGEDEIMRIGALPASGKEGDTVRGHRGLTYGPLEVPGDRPLIASFGLLK